MLLLFVVDMSTLPCGEVERTIVPFVHPPGHFEVETFPGLTEPPSYFVYASHSRDPCSSLGVLEGSVARTGTQWKEKMAQASSGYKYLSTRYSVRSDL